MRLTPHANGVSKKNFSGFHVVDAPHGAFDAAELAVVRLVAELEAGEAPGADDAAGPSGHHAPVDQQLGHRTPRPLREVAQILLGLVAQVLWKDTVGYLNSLEDAALGSRRAHEEAALPVTPHPTPGVASFLLLIKRGGNIFQNLRTRNVAEITIVRVYEGRDATTGVN